MIQYLRNAFDTLLGLLSPEDRKVEKILELDRGALYSRLPKPRNIESPYASALFDYRDDKVRTIIKVIKYKGNMAMIKRMALYLYEEIIEQATDIGLFEGGKLIIVPMPISKERRRSRGWSQCELLCSEMKKLAEGEIEVRFNILAKVKDSKRQTDLSREERLTNVQGTMKAHGKFDFNTTFIVIDDVYTTGATFSEAAGALRQAGAKEVYGLFIAH
jgi:competence protein ComFC